MKPAQIVVSGPNLSNLEKWRVLGANITDDNGVVVTKCDIIFICVKPHLLQTCAQQVEANIERTVVDKDKLFVSVLAGVSLDQLELVSEHKLDARFRIDISDLCLCCRPIVL